MWVSSSTFMWPVACPLTPPVVLFYPSLFLLWPPSLHRSPTSILSFPLGAPQMSSLRACWTVLSSLIWCPVSADSLPAAGSRLHSLITYLRAFYSVSLCFQSPELLLHLGQTPRCKSPYSYIPPFQKTRIFNSSITLTAICNYQIRVHVVIMWVEEVHSGHRQ